jgi:hypothetical protein
MEWILVEGRGGERMKERQRDQSIEELDHEVLAAY